MSHSKCLVVCLAWIATIGTLSSSLAQEGNQDASGPNLIRNGPDRAAKFAEVYNRTFDENLNALITDDGGLGSLAVMGMITTHANIVDFFSSTFGDPRMRRMHENLAAMTVTERQEALDRIAGSLQRKLELINEVDNASFDYRLTHGLRCLLFLLNEFDDARFDAISQHWLEMQGSLDVRFRQKLDEAIGAALPLAGLDRGFLFNLYLQRIVRANGQEQALQTLNEVSRESAATENDWRSAERTWTLKGEDVRVFWMVYPHLGNGKLVSKGTDIGKKLLEGLRTRALAANQ
ncbi:MAG: hypothetical protein Q8M16_11830 [Pirellulaceae bacterium]|nr:hypothetical protein [Pirellulaceae bacterium]